MYNGNKRDTHLALAAFHWSYAIESTRSHMIDEPFEWEPIKLSLLVSLMSIGGLLGALSCG